MKIKTALIEDQLKIRETLKMILEVHFPNLEIVCEAESVEEGYQKIKAYKPQLVIFDIDLINGTSFDILKMLQNEDLIDFRHIFLTAHDNSQNTIKAIKYSASDYIVKPLELEKIKPGLEKAINEIVQKVSQNKKVDLLLELLEKPFGQNNQIVIEGLKGLQSLVKVHDIIHFESDENITVFHLVGGAKIIGNRNIGHFAKSLCADFDFLQVSQGAVINLAHLNTYQHANKTLSLSENIHVMASRNGGKMLKEYLKSHDPKRLKANFIKDWIENLKWKN